MRRGCFGCPKHTLKSYWMYKALSRQLSPAAEDEDDTEEEVSQHDDHCTVCHRDDGQDMLLCDGCPKAFHLTCLGLTAVPDGNWYCAVCSDEAVNND